MRGEYSASTSKIFSVMELPPHARRIQYVKLEIQLDEGTTSACAENTPGCDAGTAAIWNYLRMRGEYITMTCCNDWIAELPPHARRILTGFLKAALEPGTTSACAENTTLPATYGLF